MNIARCDLPMFRLAEKISPNKKIKSCIFRDGITTGQAPKRPLVLASSDEHEEAEVEAS
jgi:hypothetical protein